MNHCRRTAESRIPQPPSFANLRSYRRESRAGPPKRSRPVSTTASTEVRPRHPRKLIRRGESLGSMTPRTRQMPPRGFSLPDRETSNTNAPDSGEDDNGRNLTIGAPLCASSPKFRLHLSDGEEADGNPKAIALSKRKHKRSRLKRGRSQSQMQKTISKLRTTLRNFGKRCTARSTEPIMLRRSIC